MTRAGLLECVVVGAGPAGVVATKELLEAGLRDVVCLERGPTIGGVFAHTYDSLVCTTSASFSMFSDFWIGDGRQHEFWTKDEAIAYWSRYADHFGVTSRIRFDCEVTRVESAAHGGWTVTTAAGKALETRRIAIATGNNQVPRYPVWREELGAVDVSHSHDYRSPQHYVGKRVLIVGGGESGADLALELARVAARCWVSLRADTGWIVPRHRGAVAADSATHRGFWGLPRELGPWVTRRFIERERARGERVFDVVAALNERVRARHGVFGTYGTKTVSLAEAVAEHRCTVVGDITGVRDGGRMLETADGARLEAVDAVLFCTGFDLYAPFAPREQWYRRPRQLYKHVFDPELGDRAARIGMARPAFGSQFPIMELQARWFAAVASGRQRLPARADMTRLAARDAAVVHRQFEGYARRIATLVDYHLYMDELAAILGCSPPLAELLVRDPALWLRVVYGPTQGCQFRLRGPGAKPELARELIMALPLTPLNHVFAAGVYGRALAAWQRFTSLRVR